MAVTDIVTMDSVSIEAAPRMNRDCSFAINDMRPISPADDVVRALPVGIASWADGMEAPALTGDSVAIDHTADSGTCTAPTVSQQVDTCYVTAPNMAVHDLQTPEMLTHELIPEFCKQRHIVMNDQLRSLINPDGSINMGNPYASNYFRWAYNGVARALMLWATESAIAGDSADAQTKIDGLYTQLSAGWTDAGGGDACGDALNIEQTIDWGALAGGGNPAKPDAVTAAGKTVTLWGTSFDVPAGLNLAQLLDRLWFPKVRANFTDQYGDVMWEAHVPHGAADDFLATTACLQPCDIDGTFDSELRARYAGFIESRIARFYPRGEILPFLETRYMPANTMRIGPRSIGGNPTYGLFFKNMNRYFNELYTNGMPYGQGMGMFGGNEPLLKKVQDTINIGGLDSLIFQYDLTKNGHKCITYSVLSQFALLAVSRHLWLKLTNVDYDTWITAPTSILSHTT